MMMDRLKAEGLKPYGIPVGGSTPLGAWGYMDFVRELQEQLQEASDSVSDIVVSMGSGGSAAGIALAAKLSGIGAKVAQPQILTRNPKQSSPNTQP